MKVYFKIVGMHIKSQLQNRTAFIALTLGQALLTFSGILSMLILSTNVSNIAGFTIQEVLFAGAIVTLAYAFAEGVFRGFDTFPTLLGNGHFDRILVRPHNVMLQVLGSTMELSRLGRIVVAGFIMVFVSQHLVLYHVWLIYIMVISGIVMFASLFIIYGSCSFFTTDSLEVFNILTDGGRSFGQLPYGIYGKNILKFLTFILPLACFQYYPLLIVLGRDVPWYYTLAPLGCFLMLLPAHLMWSWGRKHYQSTGS